MVQEKNRPYGERFIAGEHDLRHFPEASLRLAGAGRRDREHPIPAVKDQELGVQQLAWFGFTSVLPVAWNVTAYQGDQRLGALTLADGGGPVLEIRWRGGNPVQAERELKRQLQQLERRGASVELVEFATNTYRVTRGGATVVLLARQRLFELSWPQQPMAVEAIVRSFSDQAHQAFWRWTLYGVDGVAPARWSLRKISLLPGGSRLEFARRSQRILLGSWSMAERWLNGRSLEQWAAATIPLVKNNPAGRWSSAGATRTFSVTERRWFRGWRNTLGFRHNRQANCIVWFQVEAPDTEERMFQVVAEGLVSPERPDHASG